MSKEPYTPDLQTLAQIDAALTKLEEVVMWANAAIAREGARE